MRENYIYSEDYLLAESDFWQDVYTDDMCQKAKEKRETKSSKPRNNRYKNILLDFLKSDDRSMKLSYETKEDAKGSYSALRNSKNANIYMFSDITIKKQGECVILRKKPSLYA